MSTSEVVNTSRIAEPYHITFTRNAKGKYQWEISIHGADLDKAGTEIMKVDERLRMVYKGQLAGEEEPK